MEFFKNLRERIKMGQNKWDPFIYQFEVEKNQLCHLRGEGWHAYASTWYLKL